MNLKMNKYNLSLSIQSILILCLFLSCEGVDRKQSRVSKLPYYNEASFTPIWIEDVSTYENLHKVSSFNLINQNGDSISEKTFEGKIYVTDFFFTTCPGICPKMTSNMEIIQSKFLNQDDVLLLSHSVTPNIDSVSVLKEYAEDKGVISNKWHLATGDLEHIYRLGREEYFVEEDLGLEKDWDEFLHTENFVLVDKNKHIRGIYNGINKASVNQLIADIRTLLKE